MFDFLSDNALLDATLAQSPAPHRAQCILTAVMMLFAEAEGQRLTEATYSQRNLPKGQPFKIQEQIALQLVSFVQKVNQTRHFQACKSKYSGFKQHEVAQLFDVLANKVLRNGSNVTNTPSTQLGSTEKGSSGH